MPGISTHKKKRGGLCQTLKGERGFAMRDRTHKERTHYVLRMGDGMLVTVPEVVYLEWYRSRRREKYQKEKERKHGVCSLEALEESGNYPRQAGDSLEETVLKKMFRNKIRKAVGELRAGDRYLVYLLYYK